MKQEMIMMDEKMGMKMDENSCEDGKISSIS